jgi:DNA repair exonuclease SbcCD ATPase subunit
MLTQENGRLRQQNDQLTQENGRLGQQNEQLTKESGILKQQNRDLTQENINQKKFYNELEVSSLKTETNLNNDLAEYIREHLKLQKKYDELEKSNEQLRKKLDNEKKDVQQNEKLLREIDALKDEQQRAQQENERQRREIEELKRKSSQQSGANGGNNDAVLLNVVDWLIAHNSDYSPEPNIDTIYGVLLKKSSVSNITKLFLKQVEDYRMRKIPLEKIIAFLREEENMDALIKDGGSAVYLGLSKIYHPDKKQFANADIHLKSIVTKIMQQANELKDRYKL